MVSSSVAPRYPASARLESLSKRLKDLHHLSADGLRTDQIAAAERGSSATRLQPSSYIHPPDHPLHSEPDQITDPSFHDPSSAHQRDQVQPKSSPVTHGLQVSKESGDSGSCTTHKIAFARSVDARTRCVETAPRRSELQLAL